MEYRDYPYPPWYRNRVYWTCSAVFWVAAIGANFTCNRRLTYHWHRFLFRSLVLAFFTNRITGYIRYHNFLNYSREQLNMEYQYVQNLGGYQGRFLEDREQEVKEVFRSIVY